MEKENKETPTETEKPKKQEKPNYVTKIIDIFKMLLGYNYHTYGAKRKNL